MKENLAEIETMDELLEWAEENIAHLAYDYDFDEPGCIMIGEEPD